MPGPAPTTDDLNTEVVTYPHAVLGFRVWAVKEGMLCPLFRGPAWRPDINIAYCMHYKHVAPAVGCHCGFNAYHDLDRAIAEAKSVWRDDYENAVNVRELVIGAVAGKGDVCVHAHGFRCETAQILGIYPLTGELQSGAEAASSTHGFMPRTVSPLDPRYQLPIYPDASRLLDAVDKLPVKTIPAEQRPESDHDPIVFPPGNDYTLLERIGAIGLIMVLLSPFAMITTAISASFGIGGLSWQIVGTYLIISLVICLFAGLFRSSNSWS